MASTARVTSYAKMSQLETTRDLSERRQIRALLRTLKEKREQREQQVADDRVNNNAAAAAPPPGTARDAKDGGGVRFANADKPMERTDSGTNILELRSRRRSVAKPPPSTSFLVNKLSNVMQREKAARASSPARGVNAFKNKFENKDANNNQAGARPGNKSPAVVQTTQTRSVVQTSKTVVETKSVTHVEKKEEPEIHHPNRNALRSRRRSVAKLAVNKHEKPSAPMQNGPVITEPEVAPTAKDARFQRRLSRTRITPKMDTHAGRFTPMGKAGAVKPNAFGSPAERMAYFQQAAQQDKPAEPAKPAKPAQPAPKPAAKPPAASPVQQNKENDNQNKPIEKIPRRSPPKKKPQLKRQMSVSQLVLQWCKEQTEEYEGVNITNFSASFADGLAMAALIHKFNPDLFDYNSLKPGDRERNFTTAFQAAEKVGVAVLLDVEDLVRMKKPEPRSIQTQVQMIFSKYRPKDMDMSQLTIA
ncbi:smoothelin-like protein 2 isoform X2 [Dendronephthya gigantea]|uniref:smoothelin-like protein 2 isoform X2 n=1 Tax=Dendronephthya gigantea TaxID=151771 RepID=UPI00106C1DBC|nr:smoothelin-like protein 2 isoform X2 [Dendronephthya gigantea]